MTDLKPDATPRWVKAFGIVAAILAALVVVLLLTGHRGFTRHFGMPAATEAAPSATTSQP